MSYYSDSHNNFFASSPSYRRLSSRHFAHPPLTSARLGSGSLTAAPSPSSAPRSHLSVNFRRWDPPWILGDSPLSRLLSNITRGPNGGFRSLTSLPYRPAYPLQFVAPQMVAGWASDQDWLVDTYLWGGTGFCAFA